MAGKGSATSGSVSLRHSELELPETVVVRDIDNRVFQGIVLQAVSEIDGLSVAEGGLFNNLLHLSGNDRIKGVVVEQDEKSPSVSVRVEVNIRYGLSIPEKAEEVQSRIIEMIPKLTGLRVKNVHVVFKGVYHPSETATV